jgi:hypothetical protein
MVEKLKKKGYGDKSATRIAASIGRRKYGAEEMAKKAVASRERKE